MDLSKEPVSLKKGDAPVVIPKSEVITARCIWSSNTDYDLYAVVVYRDGSSEYIATYPDHENPAKPSTDDGSVVHKGDQDNTGGRRGGLFRRSRKADAVAEEILEIRLNENILAVIPVAYSAKKNGTGSFYRYRVTTEIISGEDRVVISAENASNNDQVYSLCPGMIENRPEGVKVSALEEYSRPGCENRASVTVQDGKVVGVDLNLGPENARK